MNKLNRYLKAFDRMQKKAPPQFEYIGRTHSYIGKIILPNKSVDLVKYEIENEENEPLEVFEMPIEVLQEFRRWLNNILED